MYKVGDRVRIRQWENMKGEFGLDEWGNIRTRVEFVDSMRPLCGLKAIIRCVRGDYIYLEFPDRKGLNADWNYSIDMLEPVDTITVKIDPADKAAAHKAVEEAIAEHRRKACEWTDEEITEAVKLSDEMILELHHRHLSPVLGYKKSENKTVLHLAKSNAESGRRWKEYTSSPRGDDPFDYDIGRCVCLCRATGREIPGFIREKNRRAKR